MNQFQLTYLSCLTLCLVAPEFYIGELEEYKSGLCSVAVCVLGEEVSVCVCEGECPRVLFLTLHLHNKRTLFI